MSDVNDDYVCPLCFELFLYPVTLPCNHTFCKLCFDQHIKNNGFTCPVCRRRLSNWLRKLNLDQSDIVDFRLWREIQKKYPEAVSARRTECTNDCLDPVLTHKGIVLEFSITVSITSIDEKDKINHCHSIEDIGKDLSSAWKGWPITDTTCRDIMQRFTHQIGYLEQKSNGNDKNIPFRNFAKPGEILQEFHEQMLAFEKLNHQKEEENLRLSEALIKMIEEDERREIELFNYKKETQLRLDEEFVKTLIENDEDAIVSVSDENSTHEDNGETAATNSSLYANSAAQIKKTVCASGSSVLLGDCLLHRCSSPIQLNSSTSSSSISSSTSSSTISSSTSSSSDSSSSHLPSMTSATATRRHDRSSIPLDTPSCSKHEIFANHYVTQAVTSISNQKMSHFAPVEAGPSTSKIDSGGKTVTVSRSSSGADSIGQELCHFKPIRASPTTPPKDGKSSFLPQVVLAQKSFTGQEVTEVTHNISSEVINVLSDNPDIDLSVEVLEESLALENQLEADRRLALQLHQKWSNEGSKKRKRGSTIKSDYNIMKKGKADLRKKVLMDRSQTTLDSMLIK